MAVGDVILFRSQQVIGRDNRLKHHLCVCASTRQYLFVCHNQRTDDFPITNADCPGLPEEESYLSLSRVLFEPSPRRVDPTCTVSAGFLKALYTHVQSSGVMSPIDKRKILGGLAAFAPPEDDA